MTAQYNSKHGTVSRPQSELYMAFTDLRNFLRFLPEDKRGDVQADFDTLSATVQGMTIGVRVARREPYSYIELQDNGAPFEFVVGLHFDAVDAGSTDFSITAEANLNFMMKMMVGGKIKEVLDKIVDSLVDISNGKVPEDIPQELKDRMSGMGY